MLYLLDANVLITAHHLYYPLDSVPEFWAWLVHKGSTADLKIPLENYEEVKDGSTDEEQDAFRLGNRGRDQVGYFIRRGS
jgi:Domain of unknown function (DUF4411)